MFERAFGKLLSHFLSKYFEDYDDTNSNSSSNSSSSSSSSNNNSLSASVWSGYIALEHLRLKAEVLRDLSRTAAVPVEIRHFGIRRLEIRVPWANITGSSAADVVIVLDGVYVLLSSSVQNEYQSVQQDVRRKRKRRLEEMEKQSSQNKNSNNSSSSSFAYLKEKFVLGLNLASAGILNDILERLQLHIRNVHVRWEDHCVSDPDHPFACGMTLESIHMVQNRSRHNKTSKAIGNDVESTPTVAHKTNISFDSTSREKNKQRQLDKGVSNGYTEGESSNDEYQTNKLVQVNHLGFYWNSIIEMEKFSNAETTSSSYQKYTIPTPYTVLCDISDQEKLFDAMSVCISRRSGDIGDSNDGGFYKGNSFTPTYVIQPIDATCQLAISKDPRNCQYVPVIDVNITIDSIDLEIRRAHYHQILTFLSMIKNRNYSKKFWIFRPELSVKDNPRLWWKYAFTVVKSQLRERHAWSWERLSETSVLRRRYCHLYKRKLLSTYHKDIQIKSSFSSLDEFSSRDNVGSSSRISHDVDDDSSYIEPLTAKELEELELIDDGLIGDMSIEDIIAIRSAIKYKIAGMIRSNEQNLPESRTQKYYSYLKYIKTIISDDDEINMEYEKLLRSLEESIDKDKGFIKQVVPKNVALRFHVKVKKGSVSLSTQVSLVDSPSSLFGVYYQRILSPYHPFLVLSLKHVMLGVAMYDDYSSFTVDMLLGDLALQEIGRDAHNFTILSRRQQKQGVSDEFETGGKENEKPLLTFDLKKNPLEMSNRDMAIGCRLEQLELYFNPQMLSLAQLKETFSPNAPSFDPGKFWDELRIASINTLKGATSKFMAKVGIATKNKNIDLDISIDAPLLIISSGNRARLVLDLGIVKITTVHIAGLSNGLSSKLSGDIDSGDLPISTGNQTPPFHLTPIRHSLGDSPYQSNRRLSFSDPFLLDPGSISVVSESKRQRRSSLRSIGASTLGDGTENNRTYGMSKISRKKSAKLWQENFYDVFEVKIDSLSVAVQCQTSEKLDQNFISKILHECSIYVKVEKSVIPFDHTMSKFKLSCVIDSLFLSISRENMHLLSVFFKGLTIDQPKVENTLSSNIEKEITKSSPIEEVNVLEDDSDDEFLDALEHLDEFDESKGEWGIDSTVGYGFVPSETHGFENSTSLNQNGSISEQSFRSRHKDKSYYLNETNLSALAEDKGGNLENSPTPSESALSNISSETFHSALSVGDHNDLLYALQEDIYRAKNEIDQLQQEILDTQSKGVKINLRLEVARLEAELRALQNSYYEFTKYVETKENNNDSLKYDLPLIPALGDDEFAEPEKCLNQFQRQNDGQIALRAKALLKSRSRRSIDVIRENVYDHSATKSLNRDLFVFSVSIKNVRIELLDSKESDIDDDNNAVFSINLTSFGFALHHRVFDTHFSSYLSSLEIFDEVVYNNDYRGRMLVLSGEGIVPLLPKKSTALSELKKLHKNGREKFFRLVVHQRHQHDDGKKHLDKAIRCKTSLGLLELVLERNSLERCLTFMVSLKNSDDNHVVSNGSNHIDQKLSFYRNFVVPDEIIATIDQKRRVPSNIFALVDVLFQFEGFRMKLYNKNEQHVFTLTGKDCFCRYSKSVSCSLTRNRSQLEIRLRNLQLFDTSESQDVPIELFGRESDNVALLELRIRTQLVPDDETRGWVIDEELHGKELQNNNQNNVWNAHFGVLLQNPRLYLPIESLSVFMSSITSLQEVFTQQKISKVEIKNTSNTNDDHFYNRSFSTLIRWRFDSIMTEANIQVPFDCESFGTRKSQDISMRIESFNVGAEKCPYAEKYVSLRSSIVGFSISLPQIGNTILTPCCFRVEILTPYSSFLTTHLCGNMPQLLDIDTDTRWSRNLNHSLVSSFIFKEPFSDSEKVVSGVFGMSFSNLHFQFSSDCLVVLHSFLRKAKSIFRGQKETHKCGSKESKPFASIIVLDMPLLELRILRENDQSTAIRFAGAIFEMGGASLSKLMLKSCIDNTDHHHKDPSECQVIMLNVKRVELYETMLSEKVQVMSILEDNLGRAFQICLQYNKMDKTSINPTVVSLDIIFGIVTSIVTPSTLNEIIDFKEKIISKISNQVNESLHEGIADIEDTGIVASYLEKLDLPFHANCMKINLHLVNLTMSFPTRDISSCLNIDEQIGAIALRLSSDLSGMLILRGDSDVLSDTFIDLSERETKVWSEQFGQLLSNDCNLLHNLTRVGLTKISLSLTSMQVLRTCIQRTTFYDEIHFDNEFCSNHLIVFNNVVPLAGEQQIMSPLNATLTICSCLTTFRQQDTDLPSFNISNAIKLETGQLNILMYAKQSEEGINEAFRISVKPLLARSHNCKRSDKQNNFLLHHSGTELISKPSNDHPLILEILRKSVSVLSITIDGFQVTLVPGGATVLTESPMMKFAVNDFKFGFGATSLPQNLIKNTNSEGFLASLSRKNPKSSLSTCSDWICSSWMTLELSSHYHNRRLVAWEPFIERWTLHARMGANLTQLLHLPRILWDESEVLQSYLPYLSSETGNENEKRGGVRIHDIKRLLIRSYGSQKQGNLLQGSTEIPIFVSDISHILLFLLASSIFDDVLYHPSSKRHEDDCSHTEAQPQRMLLCGGQQSRWLHLHGFPMKLVPNETGLCTDKSIILSFTDVKPLNINITGGLLENILGVIRHGQSDDNQETSSPHLIRNLSGHILHFTEELDRTRIERGETSDTVTLNDGDEQTLYLKRSISQTCDPHRAFLKVIIDQNYDKDCVLRPLERVPVDTVGVYEYPLTPFGDHSTNVTRCSIIIRVIIEKGTKIVTFESPFILKNTTESNLHCILKTSHGDDLWQCILPSKLSGVNEIAIPSRFSELGALLSIIPIHNNPQENFDYGKFHSENVTIDFQNIYKTRTKQEGIVYSLSTLLKVHRLFSSFDDNVNAEICLLRFCNEQNPSIHQQLILIRPPFAIKNCLPLPIQVQIRRRAPTIYLSKSNSALSLFSYGSYESSETKHINNEDWIDVKTIDCGHSTNWSGSTKTDEVEIRLKILDDCNGSPSKLFPRFSSSFVIQNGRIRQSIQQPSGSETKSQDVPFAFKISDSNDIDLEISVSVEIDVDKNKNEGMRINNLRDLSSLVDLASNVIVFHVPFWIVNDTGINLEYMAETGSVIERKFAIAGQHRVEEYENSTFNEGIGSLNWNSQITTHGDGHFLSPVEILMIGNKSAGQLRVRKAVWLESSMKLNSNERRQPWSNPFRLTSNHTGGKYHDVSAHSIRGVPWISSINFETELTLSTHIIKAPILFGGNHGTTIVHISNRYTLINTLSREIEVIPYAALSTHSICKNIVKLSCDCNGKSFHFNDNGKICFRPVEYGWLWSGPFSLKRKQNELIMRLKHRWDDETMIVTVEFKKNLPAPGLTVIFRETDYPPFRLENETLQPLKVYQRQNFFQNVENKFPLPFISRNNIDMHNPHDFLLPYQKSAFAWDETETVDSQLVFELADLDSLLTDTHLGTFKLDKLLPGSTVPLRSPDFHLEVSTDGPTRVLRIIDSTIPTPSRTIKETKNDSISFSNRSFLCNVSLTHGVGFSIVNWQPQELCYFRLNNIIFVSKIANGIEDITLKIESIIIDNQKWITSYPVFLRMGPRYDIGVADSKSVKDIYAATIRLTRVHSHSGSLSIFRKIKFSVEPIVIKVDGNLIRDLLAMLREITTISHANEEETLSFKDEVLVQSLGFGTLSRYQTLVNRHDTLFNNFVFANSNSDDYFRSRVSLMETHLEELAVLDKTIQVSTSYDDLLSIENQFSNIHTTTPENVPHAPRKIYLEELFISPIKIDLSFTGLISDYLALPISFEGAPIFLRPFTMNHSDGTLSEYLHNVKLHYINLRRLMDLVVNLFLNPLFMIPASWRTMKQINSSYFQHISGRSEKNCERFGKIAANLKPTSIPADFSFSSKVFFFLRTFPSRLFSDIVRLTLQPPMITLRLVSNLTAGISSLLANTHRYLEPSDLIRSRPPRLFATQDGKDLLVEYVEGQNAGKALLSRVRSGIYLSEGYVFHSKLASPNLLISKFGDSSLLDSDVVMMTFQRIIALKVKDNLNLFSIIFEIQLDRILFVDMVGDEFSSHDDDTTFSAKNTKKDRWSVEQKYDNVRLWFFSINNSNQEGLRQDGPQTKLNTQGAGLQSLQYHTFQWISGSGTAKIFIEEIQKIKPDIHISW